MRAERILSEIPEELWSPKERAKVEKFLEEKQQEYDQAAKRAGDLFEKETASQLKKVFGVKPLRNLLVMHPNGHETEIDMVFATTKGVFSVECKCHGRTMFGDELPTDDWITYGNLSPEENWSVVHDHSEDDIGNVFNQNSHHIEALTALLTPSGLAGCIKGVFATNTKFMINDFGRSITNENTKGFHEFPDTDMSIVRITADQRSGVRVMKKWYRALPDRYTEDEAEAITGLLSRYIGDKVSLEYHAKRVAMYER